jgi:NAD(P)-dependent dehydrogenase (short-subunit alcohol dehydrogenase family)
VLFLRILFSTLLAVKHLFLLSYKSTVTHTCDDITSKISPLELSKTMTMMKSLTNLFLITTLTLTTSLATVPPNIKSYLITGANKGQGLALCQRILTEQDDTHVFLCSRNSQRGEKAKELLIKECGDDTSKRVDVVQLDVTDEDSVQNALERVQSKLGSDGKLAGVVSNAGILWGYPLPELTEVCATGVKHVLDAFVPLVQEDGRVVVVTSGLGPLMHSYAGKEQQKALMNAKSSWEDTLAPMINECLVAYENSNTIEERIAAFEQISFSGGPFAESAPDFHMYGLAKMFGDAYMLRTAHKFPSLRVTSVDPGLVYTDLILKMPKYAGLQKEETSAQSPKEGVEGTMRLLFEDVGKGKEGSGKLYALNKERELVFSPIDRMPQKQE